ncbi:destrin isoform X1 [Ascaphus truei]|uniref:destrin isoform X1 n=1 Tax=Ascaphus truei TaxID=8439 RepID=UPI003F5A0EF3
MASGVRVDDSVLHLFQEMKLMKSGKKAVFFGFSSDEKYIIVEEGKEILSEDCNGDFFPRLKALFHENKCCYALLDIHYVTGESKKQDLIFVMWAPEDAPIKEKLLFASSKPYLKQAFSGRTSSASKKEMWNQITLAVYACGNHVRNRKNCQKRFDDIRANLKKKIQAQRMHASGTGGGPPAQALILTQLEEQMREKFLPVVVEGLPGDTDIGIYSAPFPPEADVATEREIQSSDHEDVPTRRVTQHSSPPARDTYSAIAASEERILIEENRRHSEMMSVLERMI